MSEQLFFNFPFKKSYLSQDFYVSENNFKAFKLIETWPKWSGKFVNVFLKTNFRGKKKVKRVNLQVQDLAKKEVRENIILNLNSIRYE